MIKNDYIMRLEMMKDDLEEMEEVIHKNWELCLDLLHNLKSDKIELDN